MGYASSTVYLCKVPFDATYKHQVRFDNVDAQIAYFAGRSVKALHEYYHVRKTLPDGSLQSSIKVDGHIDDFQFVNYLFFSNTGGSDVAQHRIVYAFVTKKIYISEGTTELIFETDVFQTYMFVARLTPSYVVREHSETDNVGDNLVPESFSLEDYVYTKAYDDNTLDKYGYLVISTGNGKSTSVNGDVVDGIYQGLRFFYTEDVAVLNLYLQSMPDNSEELMTIAYVPRFIVARTQEDLEKENFVGYPMGTTVPAYGQIDFEYDTNTMTFDGYKPKNRKMYTYPYFALTATNQAGKENTYIVEDFEHNVSTEGYHNAKRICFDIVGNVSVSPSLSLIPISYKGIASNIDESISISGFPQCSTATDAFRLWWVKYGAQSVSNAAFSAAATVAGVGLAATTGGALGFGMGMSTIVGGASAVSNSIFDIARAYKEPNKVNMGSPSNNLLTAMRENRIKFFWRMLRREHAQTIDDFFWMFGYQTNKLKIPNTNSRPYWNYVQTANCNIVSEIVGEGGIPNEDLMRLKQVYNNGVTIWNSTAVLGDYSQDNRV